MKITDDNPDMYHNILNQLDEHAKEYNFPMLDNAYLYNAVIRMTGFRSETEWAILFEEIAFSEVHGFINDISAYGNKITNPGTQGPFVIISESPGESIWDADGNFLLNKTNFKVVIGGQTRNFKFSLDDYRKVGIEINSNVPVPVQLLRLLASQVSDAFFMTDEMLLSKCDRISSNLIKIIQLDDWYHPDIANDELPSQNICFQKIAEVISKNSKDLYDCPPELFNTHWSNWELE